MTSKQIKRDIEHVDASLGETVQQLIEMQADPADWPAALSAAIAKLEQIRPHVPVSAKPADVAPALLKVKGRVERVQQLLDSAAMFYCGCVAVGPPQPGSYAADGEREQVSVGARIQLEA